MPVLRRVVGLGNGEVYMCPACVDESPHTASITLLTLGGDGKW